MSVLGSVIADLREGYGIEDIALRHGVEVDVVRGVVADMREKGSLDGVLKEVRKRLRMKAAAKAARRRSENA